MPYALPETATRLAGDLAVPVGDIAAVRTNATASGTLDAASGRLPVVLFSPGAGVNRPLYSGLSADLASHGYLVAVLEVAKQAVDRGGPAANRAADRITDPYDRRHGPADERYLCIARRRVAFTRFRHGSRFSRSSLRLVGRNALWRRGPRPGTSSLRRP